MKKLLIFYCFMLFVQISHAQKEANIWYFGINAGLDFNSGTPLALTDGSLSTVEGCAAISDADGNLQFYTDGSTVYNKNHDIMQNGLNLNGNFSSTQSAIIVPKPLSESIYFIFTVAAEGGAAGFCYSEVDMTANGGLGKVTTNKNIQLLSQSSEQLTAVGHSDGIGIWVITHGHANNAYHSFLVIEDGVQEDPVSSNVGVTLNGGIGAIGCMKVSPGGTKIASCHNEVGFQIADFDNTTGIVSGGEILSEVPDAYGVEFSPSGNVLYMSRFGQPTILQYDVTVVDIAASEFEIPAGVGGALQLAPDGKIYKILGADAYLSVINNPDVPGIGCNVAENGVAISAISGGLGLPSFIQSYFAFGIRAEHFCLGDVTAFSLLSAVEPQSIAWDFGDGTTSAAMEPLHSYAEPGPYTVSATVTINGNERVIEKNITIHLLPVVANMPGNLHECNGEDVNGQAIFGLSQQDGDILGEQPPNEFTVTYHDTLPEAENGGNELPEDYTNTSNPQLVYARLQNNVTGCYAITSFTLNVVPLPVIDMPDEYAFCENSSVTITAPPGFDSYLWSTGEVTDSVTVNEPGDYTVTVTQDSFGTPCEASKTVTVSASGKPVIEDVAIADWTDDKNSITISASGNGDYEYSLDGITYQDSPRFTDLMPGAYTVYVRDRNGCGFSEEEVVLLMYPRYFTPNGDGHNETWRIRYGHHEPGLLVHVFDRYGKIITSFRGGQPGWDGTLNGKNLPSTDYWFVAIRQGGQEYKGHFSMIR